MKRATYVDKQGNTVNQTFENKKPLLNIFFIIGTVLPIVMVGFIIYTMVQNNNCIKIYDAIKSSTLKYLQDSEDLPTEEGESTRVYIDKLYDGFLSSSQTNNLRCSGTVKVTKYKNDYIYTLDVRGCDKCSTNIKYTTWSNEQTAYPSNRAIVDIVPYYNYYEREVNNTDWSIYLTQDEISKKESKYGVKLPKDKTILPEVPTEANVVDIETQNKYQYRYQDKRWYWYDIEGDYSEFSSEQPEGYANKDDRVFILTDWTDWSQSAPEEKDYRSVQTAVGRKYYYLDGNEKVYYNSGQYAAPEEVDTEKYDHFDDDTVTLYRYQDRQWRWYNGQRRQYSMLTSTQPEGRPYRDDDTETLTSFSGWNDESKLTEANQSYRIEERRTVTRYRQVYEILSLKVLDKSLNHDDFEKKVGTSIPEFMEREDRKIEITYKFKYRKPA